MVVLKVACLVYWWVEMRAFLMVVSLVDWSDVVKAVLKDT